MATVAPWTGKMNQILCYDWLPKRVRNLACAMIGYPSGQDGTILSVLWWLPNWARWHSLACSGLPDVSCKKKFPESHIINPLCTKLVRSRWLEIGFVLFFWVFMDLESISVHKHAEKELGQYPGILSLHLVNNPYNWERGLFGKISNQDLDV